MPPRSNVGPRRQQGCFPLRLAATIVVVGTLCWFYVIFYVYTPIHSPSDSVEVNSIQQAPPLLGKIPMKTGTSKSLPHQEKPHSDIIYPQLEASYTEVTQNSQSSVNHNNMEQLRKESFSQAHRNDQIKEEEQHYQSVKEEEEVKSRLELKEEKEDEEEENKEELDLNKYDPGPWVGRDDILHVLFSTDCSPFQDWQSQALFYSAKMVGHEGPITRIASGCEPADEIRLRALHAQKMKHGDWSAAYIHFTPKFSKDHNTGKDYKFYNKPRGMLNWLQYGDHGKQEGNALVPTVLALIDPDQLFLRPLTTHLNNADNLLVSSPVKATKLAPSIGLGAPASQFYGLGDRWLRFNRTYICGPKSPCNNVNSADAWSQYSIGPPYILHYSDWMKVAAQWVEFVPKVYEEYPQLLAEMYAYCLSAAHHQLPHARVDSFMVSNVDSYGEGWEWIDKMTSVCDAGIPYTWNMPLPTFLHACQTYTVGKARFGKRSVDTSIFECSASLLHEPPVELMSLEDQAIVTEAVSKKEKLSKEMKKLRMVKRNAFMICTASKYVNEAVRRHRLTECPASSGA